MTLAQFFALMRGSDPASGRRPGVSHAVRRPGAFRSAADAMAALRARGIEP